MPAVPRDAYREYLFPLMIAAVLIILGTIPYVYGYRTAPEGEAFMGFVGRGTAGLNGYLMLAHQVEQGHHLIENKATPEPLPRTYFNLEWWCFGMAARLSGLSLIVVFHLDRVLTVLLFVCGVYYLARRCLDTPAQRRYALLLVVLSSGLGWILWLGAKTTGLDLPKSYDWPSLDLQGVSAFAYLINQPHFMRAAAASAFMYGFLLAGEETGKWRYFVLGGLAALTHSAIRPYHIPETYLVLALFPALLCLREGKFRVARFLPYALVGLIHFPAVPYYAYMAFENTLGMSGWQRYSRFLFSTVVWMGLPFLLICCAFVWNGARGLRSARSGTLLLGSWIFVSWLLVNTYPYFRAAHEAAFIAYAIVPGILAVAGPLPALHRFLEERGYAARLLSWVPKREKRLAVLATVFLLLCVPSNVYAFARVFRDLHDPVYPQVYYLDEGTLAGLRWLAANTDPGEVVLASHGVSQFVPRFANNKVVTYHDMLTADYYAKSQQVAQFFQNPDEDGFKLWLVREYGVDYVFLGPRERALGGLNPEEHAWMTLVFQAAGVSIYRSVARE